MAQIRREPPQGYPLSYCRGRGGIVTRDVAAECRGRITTPASSPGVTAVTSGCSTVASCLTRSCGEIGEQKLDELVRRCLVPLLDLN